MKRTVYLAAPIILIIAISAYVAWPASQAPAVATCDLPSTDIVPSNWKSWASDDAPQAMASVPIPSFTSGGRDQIDYLRENRLFVDNRGPVQQLDDVHWEDESHGNYYSTQLHGMVGIGAVLERNEELPADVERVIADYIRNWAYCAAHNPSINSRAWYEGTVIKRQSNLLRALQYMDRHGGLGDLERNELLYLIDADARFLLDTPDVYEFGNHGIRQDMLLATTALALPNHPRAGEMLRLAQRRLEEAAVELFTKEGIWKEHAPGYVNYALRLMSEVEDLSRASANFNPTLFISRYDSSLNYLLSSLLPDGSIPYVGSSGAVHPSAEVVRDDEIESALQREAESLPSFQITATRSCGAIIPTVYISSSSPARTCLPESGMQTRCRFFSTILAARGSLKAGIRAINCPA